MNFWSCSPALRDGPAIKSWPKPSRRANPQIKIAFVGPPVTTSPDKALNECAAIDFVCRREFDFSVVEFANGKPLDEILGISYLKNGSVVHIPIARR